MAKKFDIKYLGQGYTIDTVEARSPKEAIKKLMNPKLYVAFEVYDIPKNKSP